MIKVAGYCSFMNINEQNYFCCLIQQSLLNSTKVAVKHHNVRPHIVNDSRRNLQSAKHTLRHKCCTFSRKNMQCVALAS